MYLDFEQNQRSSLHMLKYTTLDLTLFQDKEERIIATADHLEQLRRVGLKDQFKTDLTESDTSLIKFRDQNSDAAYKVFTPQMAELLNQHVPNSLGTCVYIRDIMLPLFHL